MDQQRISVLYQKYLDQTATAAELRELKSVIADPVNQELLNEVLDADWHALAENDLQDVTEFRANEIFDGIVASPPASYGRFGRWPRIAAAASIILCLSAGAYFILHQQQAPQIAKLQKQDIAPGSNKAILTLSNGQRIVLNAAQNGQIAKQGLTIIQKTADGRVVYNASSRDNNSAVTYNTITTPRGGQHWITLADGSKVLLNAASSLTYPTAFNGRERKVTLTGEAYFEVAHNDRQPFSVATKGQSIKDIGTHFNINAYNDEPVITTTLIEGAIEVNTADQHQLLQPGQQTIVASGSPSIKVKAADMEATLAWKNGLFVFDDEPLESIMRKVSRWYDVDITYESADKNKAYWGSISRYDNVSKVLSQLELTGGVHFTIEGRRIIARK